MSLRSYIIASGILTMSEVDAQMIYQGRVINIEMHPFCGPMFSDQDGEGYMPETEAEINEIYELADDALRHTKAEKMAVSTLIEAMDYLKTLHYKVTERESDDTLDVHDLLDKHYETIFEGIKSKSTVMAYEYATREIQEKTYVLVYRKLENGKIEIIRHTGHFGNVPQSLKEQLPKFELPENTSRILASVKIDGKVFMVENAKVFLGPHK